jgi:hypothetical protein
MQVVSISAGKIRTALGVTTSMFLVFSALRAALAPSTAALINTGAALYHQCDIAHTNAWLWSVTCRSCAQLCVVASVLIQSVRCVLCG